LYGFVFQVKINSPQIHRDIYFATQNNIRLEQPIKHSGAIDK